MNITNLTPSNNKGTLYTIDYVSTLIAILLSTDLYYQFNSLKNKSKKTVEPMNYDLYFQKLKHYIIKYKINVCKIGLIIFATAILSSIIQVYEIQFTSNLFLGKSSYWELSKLMVLFFIEIWSEQISIKMNQWLISPIKEDCKYDFLERIKRTKIENLDNKSDHELIHAMTQKINAITASPQCIKQLCKACIYVIVNTITISSVSNMWALQICISTYLYFKYLCWSKLENNKKLEKKKSESLKDSSKETNYVFQDIKTFYQFSLIDKKTKHQEKIVNLTKKSNQLNQQIGIEWSTYSKLIHSISKLNWLLIVYQIINNLNSLPKEKISLVLASCGYLVYNFTWISNSITTAINDIASFQTYVDLIKELDQSSSNSNETRIQFNNDSITIKDTNFNVGFNQLTGKSGSGKTTFLKNLFFSNQENWDLISFLYQSSRHEFNKKSPKDSIVGMLEYNSTLFRMVYDCIELDKDKDQIMIKPSGGEVQKMRIGMVLYQAILLDVKLLIMDEPDNNIDVESFNKIMINIKKLFSDSIILFTTHKGDSLNFETNKIPINTFC